MKRILVVLALLAALGNALAAPFESKTGAFDDVARKRKIPYRVYFPSPLIGEHPVIIFSHGLGGSRDGYPQFGAQLSSHGFIVIHIQHPGSDSSLIEGVRSRVAAQLALNESVRWPINAVNRFLDVPYVVAQLPRLNEQDKVLKGHLNLQALGIAGHSYGAISTMVAAGERIGAKNQSFKVPEIKAGVLMSPSPPREEADPKLVYADVNVPLFHMTGTEDVSLVEGRDLQAKDRLVPYRTLTIPDQYLLVLEGADHATFSGRRIGSREESPEDAEHLKAALNGALVFFQAYLSGNADAKKWLRERYKTTLKPGDVFEFK